MRERLLEIPKQTCITKDNAPISIDFLIYLQIVDPLALVVNVQNVFQATEGLATTTLRAVIGDFALDDVLSKREEINQKLRVKLDEITHRWGVQVNARDTTAGGGPVVHDQADGGRAQSAGHGYGSGGYKAGQDFTS